MIYEQNTTRVQRSQNKTNSIMSNSAGETKSGDTTSLSWQPTQDEAMSTQLAAHLINHGHSQVWLSTLFSCLNLSAKERIELRSSCKLFRDSLKALPLWTTFPHPDHGTLDSFIDHLNLLWGNFFLVLLRSFLLEQKYEQDYPPIQMNQIFTRALLEKKNLDGTFNIDFGLDVRSNVHVKEMTMPTKKPEMPPFSNIIFLQNGVYDCSGCHCIEFSVQLVGESRDGTIVKGGINVA